MRRVIIRGPGLRGPQGIAGPTGLPGADGADGTDGVDGAAGALGPQGPQGSVGAQGLPGTNAVPADEAVAGYLGTSGTSASKTAAGANYATVVGLPVSAGSTGNDTTAINARLAAGAGKIVRGTPGETYWISAPLVIPSDTVLDMTGCTVKMKPGSNKNLLNNASIGSSRSVYDASITAGSTTLTSATAAFATGDVGQTVVIWDAGPNNTPWFTTIASRTSATVVEVASAPPLTVTEMAISVGPRDKNVTVIGGTWDNNGNIGSGAFSPNAHMMRLHRVDSLSVQGVRLRGTTIGYGVSIGDATEFFTDLVDAGSTKDGVHISGPAYMGQIDRTHGLQDDDLVALTASDYPGNMECFGPISHVAVNDTYCRPHPTRPVAAVKVLAGNKYWVRHVTVDGVFGASRGAPVKLGDDPSQATTTDSKMRGILVRNVRCQSLGNGSVAAPPLVEISLGTASAIEDIEIDGVFADRVGTSVGSSVVAVFNGSAVGPTIGSLKIRNVRCKGAHTQVILVQRITVTRLEIDGLSVPTAVSGMHLLRVLDPDSRIVSGSIRRLSAMLSGTGAGVFAAGQVERLTVEDSEVSGGVAVFQSTAQGLTRTLIKMSDVQSDTGWVVSAASPFDLDLSNTTHTGTQAVIDTPYIGADGSTVYGRIRNPLGRAKLSNAGGAAVLWTEPATQFAYSSTIGDILALAPALWLRPETLSTLTNNTAVASWPDSSGYSRAFTQATSTKRPLYKTAQQNGLAAVVFDGTDDLLSIANLPLSGTAASVFAVSRLDAAGSEPEIFSRAVTEMELRYSSTTRTPQVVTTAAASTAPAVALSSWHQLSGVFDGVADTLNLWVNGTSAGTSSDTYNVAATGAAAIGSRSNGTNPLTGAIGEVLVFPTALSSTDRAKVEAYLKAKWATP